MYIQNIISICGLAPKGYSKIVVTDSSYIFKNDPSFQALNLYNFFGSAATVNSYEECAYYVELGFNTSSITIFDIAKITSLTLCFFLVSYFLIKRFNFKNIKLLFNKFKNYFKKKSSKVLILSIFALFQNFYIFDFIKTKSKKIPYFIDEYIALSSNVNFFQKLDFNAGSFIGGSYSVLLTSGPVSSLGSVIAWIATSNIYFSRIANYYWLVFLEVIFIYILAKYYKMPRSTLFLYSTIFILLIPWWQGALYSLGEISSMIIFINSAFLFSKLRKTAIFLFSISIFYGKLLTLLPFIFFYIVYIIHEKSFKKIFDDFIIFIVPLLAWLVLIYFNYENGSVVEYLLDQINLVLNHQSSGVRNVQSFNLSESISLSEVENWNFYDKLRLGFAPLIFIFLLLKNKSKINTNFGKITVPLISSFLITYLWFWLFSDTKWMRYSQHFSIIMIVTLIYFLNSNIAKDKIDFFVSVVLLGIFIENQKSIILILTITIFLILVLSKEKPDIRIFNYLLIIFILIDILIPYYEKDYISELNDPLPECNVSISNKDCRNAYFDKI